MFSPRAACCAARQLTNLFQNNAGLQRRRRCRVGLAGCRRKKEGCRHTKGKDGQEHKHGIGTSVHETLSLFMVMTVILPAPLVVEASGLPASRLTNCLVQIWRCMSFVNLSQRLHGIARSASRHRKVFRYPEIRPQVARSSRTPDSPPSRSRSAGRWAKSPLQTTPTILLMASSSASGWAMLSRCTSRMILPLSVTKSSR